MSDVSILRTALFTPGPRDLWGLPMRIVGSPGTAKTDIVSRVAVESGLRVVVVLASLRDPTDFLGMPVVRDGQVSYAPPDWVREVLDHPYSVVFLDEINTCSPATQAALLRVILDRVVGNVRLPAVTRILAAQNGVDEAAGGYDVSMPLANRFGTLTDWRGPDVDAWTAWLVGDSSGDAEGNAPLEAEVEQARVMGSWRSEYARAVGVVSSFVRCKPSLLHCQPAVGSPQSSQSWPSRRTWAMATRALAASKIHGLDEADTDRYVGSFVGNAAVVELRSFTTNLDLPDPSRLLDDEIVWKHDNSRLDRTMAVLSSCAGLVLPKEALRRIERTTVLWKIVREVSDKQADVAWPTVRMLCARNVGLGDTKDKNVAAVLTRFHPMLAAAGLISRRS